MKNKIVSYLNYSRDERYIIVGDMTGSFHIWNLSTFHCEFENRPNQTILNTVFAPDNSQLLSYCKYG